MVKYELNGRNKRNVSIVNSTSEHNNIKFIADCLFFQNYIESKGITVKQVLRDSLINLDAGKYTCPGKK